MLKVLMLKRSLDAKRAELADLERKDESFQTREAELETAINEVEPGNAQQEAAVNAEIEAFEADKSAHDTAKESLRGDIASLEAELEELERNAPKPPAAEETKSKTIEKRGVATMPTINIRSLPMSQRAFDALPMERRDAMLSSSEVTDFLGQLRAMKGQSRSITGAELTIPIVFLELISENMYRYSKLLNRVRVRNVTGEARQTIAGTVPEAVWTEMCGAINELSFSFHQITVDGYKVAGFVPVCNALCWRTTTSIWPPGSWKCCLRPSAWPWTRPFCTARAARPRCPWALSPDWRSRASPGTTPQTLPLGRTCTPPT